MTYPALLSNEAINALHERLENQRIEIERVRKKIDRLGRALLLFHRGGEWTGQDRNEWVMLTGEEDATTKVLCDLARKLLARPADGAT